MKEELEKLKSELTQRIDQIIKQSSERKEGWYKHAAILAHTSGYGIHSTFDWQDEQYWFDSYTNWTPATPKEVEEALIKVAEKKGFKEGVKIKGGFFGNEYKDFTLTLKQRISYGPSDDNLFVHGGYKENGCGANIYRKGQWAEIISEPKLTLGGYDVEIYENRGDYPIWINRGCFSIQQIEMFSKATQEEYTNLLNKMKS